MVQTDSKSEVSKFHNRESIPLASHTNKSPSQTVALGEQTLLSDRVIQYLEQLQVKFVFGIPGGAIEPFFDALARSERRGGPRLVMARHETGSAFMADGYQHYSGKLGVCCATTGPGTTNLITGVASAYANQIPLLVITAQTALPNFSTGALQDSSCTGINTMAMMQACTRYNSFVSHAEQLENKLAQAIKAAFGPYPGPVHLSVPFDLWRVPASTTAPKYSLPNLATQPSSVEPRQIDAVLKRLTQADKIVFVVGERCSEAIKPLLETATMLHAQVVTTPLAKSQIHPYHPLYRGVVGFGGHASALQAVSAHDVDCIVTVGAYMSEFAISGVSRNILEEKGLIHIDQNCKNFALTPMANIQVYGPIKEIFAELSEKLKRFKSPNVKQPLLHPASPASQRFLAPEDIKAYNDNRSPIHPARLMRELPAIFPPNTRYLADCGNSFAWAIHYLQPAERRIGGVRDRTDELFKTCIEYASMGWAIGCAVGVALALPQQPVVCITGDGSLLMSGQELTVARQENLPVIFVILNDSAYGMVKHGQRLTGAERFAHQLPKVDFVAYANSMGVQALSIESPQDLRQLKLIDFNNRPEPLLLDVHIDAEAIPPIQQRTTVLKKKKPERTHA